MQINHNLTALNTYNYMETNTKASSASISKLSSGLRINKAGDDAAGLAISEKMRAQIRGLDQAGRNAQDGVSMIQTAEGGLNEVHSILQRMRELADQSANGTNTTDDRDAIQTEVTQLKSEIDRIGNTTEFNTQKLLNGNLQSAGAIAGQNQTLSSVVGKLTAAKLTSVAAISATDASGIVFTNKDTLTVDGQAIEVNWDTLLTQDQKDSLQVNFGGSAMTQTAVNKVKDILVNTLNTAIDNFNQSTGKNVQHVSGYLDSTNNLNLESASKGTPSQVKIAGAATSVGSLLISDTANTSSTLKIGSAIFNGTSVADNGLLYFKVNGVELQASLTQGPISPGTTLMTSAATIIQSAMNIAISHYNSLSGKALGDAEYIQLAKVVAGDDGRLVVSDESGSITFRDPDGVKTADSLGLSMAQTEAAGNGGMTFQIGANKNQTITFGINDMRTNALGISGIDVSNASGAQTALSSLDSAIKKVSSERAKIGAIQNRLEHTVNNLGTSSENLTAAESRIRDVDMAKEMMNFQKTNILTQAAQAMMAQANQQPQGVLQLLR